MSDFLGTLYNKWHIFDQSPEMWVYPSSVYWDPSVHLRLFSTWERGRQKGRQNRKWDLSLVLKNILILMKRGRFRKLFAESWYCKLVSDPQTNLLGFRHCSASQIGSGHNVSRAHHVMMFMVTSLKYSDRRSTILKPNQCLWGDEWFPCNPKSESRKSKWKTSSDIPTERGGDVPASSIRTVVSSFCLSRSPNHLLKG